MAVGSQSWLPDEVTVDEFVCVCAIAVCARSHAFAGVQTRCRELYELYIFNNTLTFIRPQFPTQDEHGCVCACGEQCFKREKY